jgi:pyruvate dehydrogenase E2 component (dihydrolipoamide acetyltransferase)
VAELIIMPKLGFDMAEGLLQEWLKKTGEQVKEGETLAIIETDKASVEVPSFRSGVLLRILVDAGTSVPIGTPIAVIGNEGEAVDMAALGLSETAPAAAAPTEAAGAAVTVEASRQGAAAADIILPSAATEETAEVEGGRLAASPVAMRMAAELGIDLRQVMGTGPGGRIIKRDIETHLTERRRSAISAAAHADAVCEPTMGYTAVPLSPSPDHRATRGEQTRPALHITARNMAAQCASQLNALLPDDQKISVNDLIIKAAALALRESPNLNASFAGTEIRVHEAVNVGIAVARETGLLTVVIHDCDTKSLAQIASEARELVGRARRAHETGRHGGRHLHNQQPWDVRRRPLHRHHQPAASGDPGRRFRGADAGRGGRTARRRHAHEDDDLGRSSRDGRRGGCALHASSHG